MKTRESTIIADNIKGQRLIDNLKGLGTKGIIDGKRSRLACSDQDKEEGIRVSLDQMPAEIKKVIEAVEAQQPWLF